MKTIDGNNYQVKLCPAGSGTIIIYQTISEYGQEFPWHIDFVREVKTASAGEVDQIVEKYYKGRKGRKTN